MANLKDVEINIEKQLIDEIKAIREAGDKLAQASHRVQSTYDGIHRLRLALANWYKVRADEFGRAK